MHDYAVRRGVVFQTNNARKSSLLADLTPSASADLAGALVATIQGGAPTITTSTAFLGFQESAIACPALVVLRQVEKTGDLFGRRACLRVAQDAWPLSARYYYLMRAESVVLSLLPITVGTQLAALRLNALQGRWAHMLVSSRHYLSQPRLSRSQVHMACADLGWRPLWDTTIITAILLYERMRHDAPVHEHTAWACHAHPPSGTWIAQVRALQVRFGITPLRLPQEHLTFTTCQRQMLFKKYSREVVAPAVMKGLKHHVPYNKSLPWGWVAVCLTTQQQQKAFAMWWSLRIRGQLPDSVAACCPCCGVPCDSLSVHLVNGCPAARQQAILEGVDIANLFDRPTGPEQLLALLRVIMGIWNMSIKLPANAMHVTSRADLGDVNVTLNNAVPSVDLCSDGRIGSSHGWVISSTSASDSDSSVLSDGVCPPPAVSMDMAASRETVTLAGNSRSGCERPWLAAWMASLPKATG